MHGMTALFAAVASHKLDNVAALLKHDEIDVNQPNQFGGSALHHTAFATDRVDIAELLISKGANMFLRDYENNTPLHVAHLRRRRKMFQYLKTKMMEDEPAWKCDVSEDGWNSATDGTECSASESKEESFNAANPSSIPNPLTPAQMKHNSATSESFSPPPTNCNTSPYREPTINEGDLISLSLVNGDSAPATSLNDHHSMESNFSQQDTDSSKSPDDSNHDVALLHHPNPIRKLSVESNGTNGSVGVRIMRSSSGKSNGSVNGVNMIPTSHAALHKASSNPMRLKSKSKKKRKRTKSKSPIPTMQTHSGSLESIHQRRLRLAHRMEHANLSQEAKELLQEQQGLFQVEQQMWMLSVKNQMKQMHNRLNQYAEYHSRSQHEMNQLKQENSVLKRRFRKAGDAHEYSHGANMTAIISKKNKSSPETKHRKEFKKWFKREIGDDFMEYFDLFSEAGFDDLRTIRHILHESELADLGIEKKGHRLYILDKIENYRLQFNQSHLANVAQPAPAAAAAAAAVNGNSPLLMGAAAPSFVQPPFAMMDSMDMEGNTKTE